MKVLVFSHEFPPALGGAGSVAKRNVEALIGAGVEVTVLTKEGAESVEGASFLRLRVYSRFWFLSYIVFLLFRKCWLRNFDLILLNDTAAIYIGGVCMSRDVLSKSLVFMHGSEIETIIDNQSLIKRLQFFRYFCSRGIARCKNVIFPSEWLRQKFKRHERMGHFFRHSTVVYAGINQEVFYEVESDVRQSLSIPNNAPLIVSVSRVIDMKGYPEMYELFHRLHRTGKGYHWMIIGDGDYLDELRHRLITDGMGQYVHILGSMPQAELRKYYSAADVFLLLSKFEEAYGLVYLEAAATGTPSIALRKGGVSEAILEGKSGFVVDTVEECFSLLDGEAWRLLKSEKMKAFVGRICSGGLLRLEEFGSLK